MMASVLAAVPGLPAAGADGVDAILNKAEQALGGRDMLAKIESVRIHSRGVWAMPARGIPATEYKVDAAFRRPDRIRIHWEFPEEFSGSFALGYDGQDAWALWGGPPARSQGWLREIVLHAATEFQLYLVAPARAAHGDAFALEGAAEGEEEDPSLVRVAYRPFAAGEPWSVWFDKDAGHLVKLEHESYGMGGQPILARIIRSAPMKPKNFDGLIYPSQQKFESTRDGQVVDAGEETVEAIELNPDLPSDFFACPAWNVDPATIAVKEVAEQTVVLFEHRGPRTNIGKSLAPMMDVIMASGLVPVGAASGAYLNDVAAPNDERTELAVRVAKVQEGEPTLPAGYQFATRPAMRVAYAYHRGDYKQEGEAHARLRAWITSEGLSAAGPPRVIWFHDPEVAVVGDMISEIQIPVQNADAPALRKAAFNPLPLDDPWPRWIVGQWTGVGESDAGTGRGIMRAELALNGQFLMITAEAKVEAISAGQEQFLKTQLHATAEEIERFKAAPFRGLELYTVDQATGDVVGYLFDSLRCIATGRGQWSETELVMDWKWASGHTSVRTTTKLSDDKFIAVEKIAMPDDSVMEESGEMVRVK
jgi:effector-binding domain-containing protein